MQVEWRRLVSSSEDDGLAVEDEPQLIIARARRRERNRFAVRHDPIGASMSEFGFVGRGSARDDPSTSSFARTNSCWRVFYHHAIHRCQSQERRTFQVRLRVRFSVLYVVTRDQPVGDRQPRRAQTGLRQTAGTGCHDRPSFGRKSVQQFACTRQRHYAIQIFKLAAFHFAVLRLSIRIWEIITNRSDARTSVRSANNFVGVETVRDCPSRPDTNDSRCGVNQHAIQVKKKSSTGDFGHSPR